jgi:hypothetical protein
MNPHEVLGVAPNATPSDIKSAYRKLAKEHHPDRNGGSEASARKFQEIQNAYDMRCGVTSRSNRTSSSNQSNFHHNFHFQLRHGPDVRAHAPAHGQSQHAGARRRLLWSSRSTAALSISKSTPTASSATSRSASRQGSATARLFASKARQDSPTRSTHRETSWS